VLGAVVLVGVAFVAFARDPDAFVEADPYGDGY
jgi:hypothetical protein